MIEAEILEYEARENGSQQSAKQFFIGEGTVNSPAYLSGGLIDEAGKLAQEKAKTTGVDFYFTVESDSNLFKASPDGSISEPDVMPAVIKNNERRIQIFTLLQGKE